MLHQHPQPNMFYTMRKIICTLTALFCLSMAAQAQTFQAGIKGGLSSSNVTLTDLQNDPMQYTKAENVTGYHAGAFARLQILGILLQPEFILATSGGKVEVTDNTSSTSVHVQKFRFDRIDVPLLLGYNFFKVARVQAGPVASNLITAKQESRNVKEFFAGSDWGYQAGLGVDIGNLTLDVRYENINRKYTNTVQQSGGKVRNEQFLVSLGLKLIK
ncbi:Outer membrane protein beta-barrel domain-containing protein [Pontibacter akesuensis]|uniref:Outer membrane protein beta-barrel domain-containing protein n=2 Tax=Pontibacter akesuensis TaxID=388950 RepID=A0A1I7K8X7_9BACT|nr:Outer membrane protein beta-barrel domain-containing protein [Pontibacter akesuensis]